MSTNSEGPRSFTRFLEQLAGGEAVAALSYELQQLTLKLEEETSDQGKELSATLKLEIKLTAAPGGYVAVGYDVSVKNPKQRRTGSALYITKGGNLTVENPRQRKLPLREVETRAEMRDVAAETTLRDI